MTASTHYKEKELPSFRVEGYCTNGAMYKDFEEHNRRTSDMKIDYDDFY
jgi:hypothetical protein